MRSPVFGSGDDSKSLSLLPFMKYFGGYLISLFCPASDQTSHIAREGLTEIRSKWIDKYLGEIRKMQKVQKPPDKTFRGYEENTTAAKIMFCLAGRVIEKETLAQYKPRTK